MGISTKSLAGSFSLGSLSRVKLGNITPEDRYANDYEKIDYTVDNDTEPSVFSIFSGLFGGTESETGATVSMISNDTTMAPDLLDILKGLGISEQYYDAIAQLYNTIMENQRQFFSYDFQHELIKEWIATTNISIADLLNEIIKNKTGLDIHITDAFIEKYGDAIIDNLVNIDIDVMGAIFGGRVDISLVLLDIIDDLQSSDVKIVGHAIYDLFTIIDELNIPYDEIKAFFPGLADYFKNIINIDGLVITDQTLKALWDSMVYYKDKFDQGDYNFFSSDWNNNNSTTADIVRALRDIYPSFFDIVDLIGGEEVTDYIFKKIIRKMPDIIDDFMDIISSFEGAGVFDYPGLIGNFIGFLIEYDIDVWEIVGGIGGQCFSQVGEYIISGQMVDDAWGLAQDVGGAIADGAVSTWNYVTSGEMLEDVGGVIEDISTWSIWIWNW